MRKAIFTVILAAGIAGAGVILISAGYPSNYGYCAQQYPMLFGASICGNVATATKQAVGRSNGTFVRGSNGVLLEGGLTAPVWSTLSTGEPRSWEHTDGHTYAIVEGVQVERQQNNWFTDAPWPAGDCVNSTTCSRESNALGPGGFVERVTFDVNNNTGQFRGVTGSTGVPVGGWVTSCVYAWVESGTGTFTLQSRSGGAPPNVVANIDVTATTTPQEFCVRVQRDATVTNDAAYTNMIEWVNGDGSGQDFIVGYLSTIVTSGVTSTPIENDNPNSPITAHTQREADVLPFSTADLSVEAGEGMVDVAWLDYAYDWPATPAVHTVVSLAKPGEVRDESGNSLTGTITGTTYDGDGMLFDDDGDVIDLANVASLGSTGTIAAWVYPTEASNGYLYVGKTSGITNGRHPMLVWLSSKFRLSVTDGASGKSQDAGSSLALNKWYLVVGTWDGGADDLDLYVYEEGVGLKEATTGTIGFTPANASAADAIGRYQAGSQGFDGTIAKLAAYSDVKDSAWVAAEFTRGRKAPGCTTGSLELCFDMVPTDCRVYYDRPTTSTNQFVYTCGGPTVIQTTTFARGDVTRLSWRHQTGKMLELCVGGVCGMSTLNYVAPSAFDTNGCWGCDDPDGTPVNFLDGGLRNGYLR